MIRRLLTLTVLAMFLASVPAGCSTDVVPPADPVVVTFAYPSYLTAFNEASYQELADAFNRDNADLQVEIREVTSDELWEMWSKGGDLVDLLTDPETGVDVFMSRYFPYFAGNEQLLALDPLLDAHEELDLDDFYPLGLDLLRSDGQLNALPAELDLAVVYYNKDLFDQAGVAYPARDWTIDDFLATAIALRKGLSEQDIAFGGQVDEAVPFVYAHGGLLKRGADFTLTHSHTSEALRWYADLALTHNVMALPARWETYQPEPGEGSISITETTVGEGETPAADRRWGSIAAMAQMAAQEGDVALWSAPLSERQGTGGWDWDFEWGVVPWPRDQVNIVLPYAFAYFIPAATPQPEAALRWIDFLTRQPPQLKGVPVRRSVAESEQVRQALGNAIGAEAYDACRASIEEATPVDYQLYSGAELILGQALLDVLEGGLEVETALSRAQDELGAQP